MKKILLISLLALMSVSVWGMEAGLPLTEEEQQIEEATRRSLASQSEEEIEQYVLGLSKKMAEERQAFQKQPEPAVFGSEEERKRVVEDTNTAYDKLKEYKEMFTRMEGEWGKKQVQENIDFWQNIFDKHVKRIQELSESRSTPPPVQTRQVGEKSLRELPPQTTPPPQQPEVLQPPTRQAPQLEEVRRQKEVIPPSDASSKGKYIAGGAAVLGTLGVLVWGGLTLWQKHAIANVLAQFGLKPEDLTQQQRNLLAATFNTRYNRWALRAYAGKFDESAPIFFPHAWQILPRLYYVRKPTRAKIAEFKNYMLGRR